MTLLSTLGGSQLTSHPYPQQDPVVQGAGQEEQEEVVVAPVSILAACDPAKRKAPRKMAWSLTILFMEDNINGISFVPSINIGLSLEFILFHSWRMAF